LRLSAAHSQDAGSATWVEWSEVFNCEAELTREYDLVIVGSGVAGLYGALLRRRGRPRVARLEGPPVLTSSSWLAQGGIAATTELDDTPELHAADTVRAGRGLCRESAVRALTLEAPARIVDLSDLGVRFDDQLGLEGGHSRRRVHSVGGAQTAARSLACWRAPCSRIRAST